MSFFSKGDKMNIKRSGITTVAKAYCVTCGASSAYPNDAEALEYAITHTNETGHTVQIFRKTLDSLTVSK